MNGKLYLKRRCICCIIENTCITDALPTNVGTEQYVFFIFLYILGQTQSDRQTDRHTDREREIDKHNNSIMPYNLQVLQRERERER